MANKRIKDLTSVDATTLGDRVAIDGATTRSITVEKFLGRPAATGDGTTNDTDGIQDAIDAIDDAGGGVLNVPPGTYMVGSIALCSGLTLRGSGIGVTIFKLRAAPAAGADWIYGSGIEDVVIEGITFDGNGFMTNAASSSYPNIFGIIHLTNDTNRVWIQHNEFIGWATAGILTNTVWDITVRNNIVTRSAAVRTESYAITLTGTGTVDGHELRNFVIHNNRCTNGQISVCGHDGSITNNVVTGWGFSAGVNTQALASNFNLYIAGNKCFDSNQNTDQPGGYYPAGIENWARNSTIVGNVCSGNYGSGIDNGGANCDIIGNQCYNNGTGTASGGITLHAQDATYNCSGTILTGNRCTDLRSGGSKTQAYGLLEHANLATYVTGIVIGVNDFEGNLTGRMLLQTLTGSAPKRASSLAADVILDSTTGFTGGYHQSINSLSLANNGFQHFIASGGTHTANRTLTLTLNDANRTLNMGGNVTLAGQFTTIGANALTLNTTGTTNVTFPALTGGETLATLSGTENLSNKTLITNTNLNLNQNTNTAFTVQNTDAGASASATLGATTNAGTILLSASSTAGSAVGVFRWTGAGAFFLDANNATGNFDFRTGSGPTSALTISSGQIVAIQADRGLRFNNATSAAAAATGTLTNAPAAGNPTHWLKINIGGTNFAVPCWPG